VRLPRKFAINEINPLIDRSHHPQPTHVAGDKIQRPGHGWRMRAGSKLIATSLHARHKRTAV